MKVDGHRKSPPPRRLGRVLRWGVLVFYLAWVVGQLARDATWVTGLAFYIPSVVLPPTLAAFAVWCVVTRRAWAGLLAMAAVVPPVCIVVAVENDFSEKPRCHDPGRRLMHWNTGGRPTRAGVEDLLVLEHADIYVLSEIPNAEHVGFFRQRLGYGYQDVTFGNLAVVARGGVRADGWLHDADGVRVQQVTWAVDGRPVRLLVVDLPSDVRVARDPHLRAVIGLVESTRPALVVGDFNAPRRSWALSNLPTGYRHAYHTCGGGWGYTWPLPVPLFSLDHVLHSSEVVPTAYRLGGAGGDSDHCYQVFDFVLPQPVD